MPIFEYKCCKCNADFEKLVYGDKVIECPACGSSETKKKMSLFGVSGVEKHVHSSGSGGCGSCGKSSCSTC
ncbi:MAG: zinc ribbon domain-containing protein [Nitrospirae bacterium]|nr:zinc ribbon domain-containing protein [Nitrospirota bacterium]